MSTAVAAFWLAVAFLAFVAAMATVFAVCVRERRRQEPLPDKGAGTAADNAALNTDFTSETGWRSPKIRHLQPISMGDNATNFSAVYADKHGDEKSDNRVAIVIFGGIVVGALLALLVGYVVFFSGLAD